MQSALFYYCTLGKYKIYFIKYINIYINIYIYEDVCGLNRGFVVFLLFFSLNEGQCHKNLTSDMSRPKRPVGRNVLTTSSNKHDKDTFFFFVHTTNY